MFDVDMSSDSVCLYCAFKKKKKIVAVSVFKGLFNEISVFHVLKSFNQCAATYNKFI